MRAGCVQAHSITRGCRPRDRIGPRTASTIEAGDASRPPLVHRSRQGQVGQRAVVAVHGRPVDRTRDLKHTSRGEVTTYRVIERRQRHHRLRVRLVLGAGRGPIAHPAVQGFHVPAQVRQARPQRVRDGEGRTPGGFRPSGLAGDRQPTPDRTRRHPGRGHGDPHVHRLQRFWPRPAREDDPPPTGAPGPGPETPTRETTLGRQQRTVACGR